MNDFIHLPITHSNGGMYIRKSLVGAVVQRDDGKSEVYYGSESWLSPLPAEEIMALIGSVAVQEKAARTIVTTDERQANEIVTPSDEGWRTFATFAEFCEWAKGKTFEARQQGGYTTSGPLVLSNLLGHENVRRGVFDAMWKWRESCSYREVKP